MTSCVVAGMLTGSHCDIIEQVEYYEHHNDNDNDNDTFEYLAPAGAVLRPYCSSYAFSPNTLLHAMVVILEEHTAWSG